jgi:rod shape-determining protein MreC
LNTTPAPRRGLRASRVVLFGVAAALTLAVMALSIIGLLTPVESLISAPLNAVSGVANRIAFQLSGGVGDLAAIRSLQARNAELETALARYQAELIELREIESDYRRLTDLLDYRNRRADLETLTADIIAIDQNAELRAVVINVGTRDGVAVGMPVITEQGLVGRVIQVQAQAARVLLVSDVSSAVSARLQTTRAEGTVRGQVSGNLLMTFIPLDQPIQEGDLVITSGLGANFPPDITIGQVTSSRRGQDLYQEAQVRSLINFDTLEFVLVVTSFQPIDLSAFE